MAKGRLSEKYVQDAALEFLEKYYFEKVSPVIIHSRKEVVVKKEYGGGRADGLIVMQKPNDELFVVSMEAKSYKTWFNIYAYDDDSKFLKHIIAISVIISLIAMFIGWGHHWFWNWIFPLFIFFVSLVICARIMMDNPNYVKVGVVDQINKYPANEKWISISTDSYNWFDELTKEGICKKCKSEGIGLLLISPGKKAKIIEYPKPSNKNKKVDFLRYYSKGSEIKDILINNC